MNHHQEIEYNSYNSAVAQVGYKVAFRCSKPALPLCNSLYQDLHEAQKGFLAVKNGPQEQIE